MWGSLDILKQYNNTKYPCVCVWLCVCDCVCVCVCVCDCVCVCVCMCDCVRVTVCVGVCVYMVNGNCTVGNWWRPGPKVSFIWIFHCTCTIVISIQYRCVQYRCVQYRCVQYRCVPYLQHSLVWIYKQLVPSSLVQIALLFLHKQTTYKHITDTCISYYTISLYYIPCSW